MKLHEITNNLTFSKRLIYLVGYVLILAHKIFFYHLTATTRLGCNETFCARKKSESLLESAKQKKKERKEEK